MQQQGGSKALARCNVADAACRALIELGLMDPVSHKPTMFALEAVRTQGNAASPPPSARPHPIADIPKFAVEDVLDSGKNPVSALKEYADLVRTPQPVYQVSGSGPAHAPIFTTTVILFGHAAASKGPNKAKSKEEAAKNWLYSYADNFSIEDFSVTL